MERKLVVALDEMARGAGDEQLVNLFTEHRRVTEAQAGRIGEVFGLLSSPVSRTSCRAVDDLMGDAAGGPPAELLAALLIERATRT